MNEERLVRAVALSVAIGFMGLSAVINWRYGVTLARNSEDRIVFAVGSLLVDVAKAVTPFLFFLCVGQREWSRAFVAVSFWAVCTIYSLASLTGFAEQQRAANADVVASRQLSRQTLTEELQRRRAERRGLGDTLPSPVVAAMLEGLRKDRRWQSSEECAKIKGDGAKSYCRNVAEKITDHRRAVEAERLDVEIRKLSDALDGIGGSADAEAGDPRAAFAARLLGWRASATDAALVVLFLAVVEIGSGLGLFMASSVAPWRAGSGGGVPCPAKTGSGAKQREKVGDDCRDTVTMFARSRLVSRPSETMSVAAAYDKYREWCREEDVTRPLSPEDFAREFVELARALELRVGESEDDLVLVGVGVT